MSIITTNINKISKEVTAYETILTPKAVTQGKYELSQYSPTPEEAEMRAMIIKHFALGYTTMYTPRVEFNDLSVIQRMQVDQMSWNTYQSNNGQAAWGDEVDGWRSRAVRPIVRNKVVSIAAHATARMIFPKVFAYNDTNDEQKDAGRVIEDLMEWAADQSNYAKSSLERTISALTDPASIGYTEYAEVYRKVKRTQPDGSYKEELICDEELSGFQDRTVSNDELYIENFYEPDIQKQGWLIWRRVISYSLAEAKYGAKYDNFKYVKPGVQILFNDANQAFYQVYDPQMRQWDVEEIIYWNRSLDVKIIMVNGVMLTPHDNPNPRNDKLYPFDKFGYELINTRCFYYKSLAFKLQHDADIVNTLYPMIIDGTYLNLMPPMVQIGDEIIGSEVIVPGAVTTLQSKDADLRAIRTSNNLNAGLAALGQVEQSIAESSQEPLQQGMAPGKGTTAYEISRLEANAATVLGLFIQMIAQHVKNFGRLRLGDILQYLTIADVDKITADAPLVYKTFLLHDKQSNGTSKTRKIAFQGDMPMEPISSDEYMKMSYDVLQKGDQTDVELWLANPELIRNLKYMIALSPDVLSPRSEEFERALDLETYDRMIQNPQADPEETFRLLLSTNQKTRRNPDKYIVEQQQPMLGGAAAGLNPQQLSPLAPAKGGQMAQAAATKSQLPQTSPQLNLQ